MSVMSMVSRVPGVSVSRANSLSWDKEGFLYDTQGDVGGDCLNIILVAWKNPI